VPLGYKSIVAGTLYLPGFLLLFCGAIDFSMKADTAPEKMPYFMCGKSRHLLAVIIAW